jgi:hypothetical protein
MQVLGITALIASSASTGTDQRMAVQLNATNVA